MPAIVDHDAGDADGPLCLAESGAILLYLADKTGRFMPSTPRSRHQAMQWLMWQMSQLGPMLGQNGHFSLYATEKIPYAIARYRHEVLRLFGELNRQLVDREYICNENRIDDMASSPWVLPNKSQQIDRKQIPEIRRWYDQLKSRPGLRRGYNLLREARSKRGSESPDQEARQHLFNSTQAR